MILSVARRSVTLQLHRYLYMSTTSARTCGPIESNIRQKLTSQLPPSTEIVISNDSYQHRHHAAMIEAQGGPETHFSLRIVSDAFRGKTTMQRHRMIFSILSEEMAQGLHSLSVKAKTPEEISHAKDA